MENKPIQLGTNTTDILTMITKGAVGIIPFAGSILAELIGNLIPQQRIDRISYFCEILNKKLAEMGKDIESLKRRMVDVNFIDLFEDGAFQCIRALTKDRIEYIASILKNSLTDEQLDYARYKKILNILNQLNDAEIIHLCYYFLEQDQANSFQKKHSSILTPARRYLNSTKNEIDANTIQTSYINQLVNLHLLDPVFKKNKQGEIPDFDLDTGMIKATRYEISRLGILVIESIDIAKK